MIDRFKAVDVGTEAIGRADQLTVKLYRNVDGGVSSTIELQGSTIVFEDDDDGDTVNDDREAALQFLRQLMTAFEGSRPE